jgi:hypothetical protein
MSPWIWLRVAGGLLGFFLAGHTFGALNARPPDAAGQVVLDAMRSYHFEILGSSRTYWDFYFGLNLLLSANLAILSVMTFQLANLSKTEPGRAFGPAITLFIGCVMLAVLCWGYFFVAPAMICTLAAIACAVALYRLSLAHGSSRRAHEQPVQS